MPRRIQWKMANDKSQMENAPLATKGKCSACPRSTSVGLPHYLELPEV
jgi:hypothetical protein